MLSGARPDKDEGSMRLSMVWSYGTSSSAVERLYALFKHMLVWSLLLIASDTAFAQSSVASGSVPIKMVVLGDSLSAGFGLSEPDAFPAKLQKALKAKGIAVDMTNAGVSGDTSSGGRDRLDWSVPDGTQAVIVELGANDALRGIDPAVTRAALIDIVKQLKGRGVAVMLCGMVAPPNYGADFAARFNSIYPDIAQTYGVPLYPFFLEGVAANPKLNQADGMHPTAEGVDIIVKNILPAVETFLGSISKRAS
ncbi:MAG: arylesterase [Bradyrhizobium sp.]|jgi:acyl-CoA thioesterase I